MLNPYMIQLIHQMTQKPTCYMCDKPGITREHVPPQAIFPEFADIGEDHRFQLRTVPSCPKHNSKKSHDDQFLQFILCLHIDSNDVGKKQFYTKIMRAVKKFPKTYNDFIDLKEPVQKGGKNIGGAFQFDRKRLDGCIEHIYRAMFYDLHKKKWPYKLVIISCPSLLNADGQNLVIHEPSIQQAAATSLFLGNEIFHGHNPQVFRYRTRYESEAEAFALQMVYYDSFEFYAYSAKGIDEEFSLTNDESNNVVRRTGA